MGRRWNLLTVCAAVAIVTVAGFPQSRAQEKGPNVTPGANGGCVYHKNVGGGTREDIQIANGATYHQEAVKGKKSGIVYVPDRMWLCKDGHFSKAD
jgi:hypothetical protein